MSPTLPRIVGIIPCYNHGATVGQVVVGAQKFLSDLILVNDGSTDATASVLAHFTDAEVISFGVNMGKGAALRAAFMRAAERGFTHAITLDADGQHLARDIPHFIEAIQRSPETLWIGNRSVACTDEESRAEGIDQVEAPKHRRFGRSFGAFWYRFHTGRRIGDTQCGFRAYPLKRILALGCTGKRYEYEIELLVRAAWNGTAVEEIPIHLLYFPPSQRVSHFNPIVDFARISKLNSIYSLIRIFTPWRTVAVPGKSGIDKILYLAQQELRANATPGRAAWSLALGVFLAIFPIHGLQVVTALGLSVALRLNRALVLLGVSVSSAPMLPFIIAAAVGIGRLVVPGELLSAVVTPTSPKILRYGIEFVAGSVLLAFAAGGLTLAVAYVGFQRLRARRLSEES